MATIDSKEIVNDVARGKYADDQPETITQYKNAWGKVTWGVTFRGEPRNKYQQPSDYVQGPLSIWQIEDGYLTKDLIP